MPFLSFTKFRIPQGDSLMARINENFGLSQAEPPGENWICALKPLIKASGHERSLWGQIIEKPDTVLLYTEWESQVRYDKFRQSAGYTDLYWPALSVVDSPSVQTALYSDYCALPPIKYLTIITCYFPSTLSEENRKGINNPKFQGLHMTGVGRIGGNVNPNNLHYYLPKKMWATDLEKKDGMEMKALIWLHFWKNAEKEEEFLRRTRPVGIFGNEQVPVKEEFEQRLRDHDCRELIVEHFNLIRINLGEL
ncbi:hypothetical protein OCU04_004069 [Sclerotinia nivalis]|uniref:Uncharacterized protein n=1 Tax=Sclerotinia nivalis TaxID=352851 RepID=A0A9X0ATA5_9HELO|nr:hypothetical protein OCU04_004069 [Sclerotinia nivalis]